MIVAGISHDYATGAACIGLPEGAQYADALVLEGLTIRHVIRRGKFIAQSQHELVDF